ncbi:Serine/threonine-protein kinase PknD [Streptomyces alboniger]
MSQDGAQGRYAGRAIAGGRYQLRDLLGEGGMASVHLAYDSVLDRQVAIKTLHTELGREQAFRERFRREAQAVAKLTHTNIVSVFDTGEDDLDGTTMPYIVMEYVEGQPLGSVLNTDVGQYGAMPADKALKITADVLAALEISHEMGLVHRDIKPGNVMMTKRGVVKVMDFGIARAMQSGVTSMTQTGMVVGTPQYLSPEQALGRGVDARSDLYSVGIMLFQLVTGRLPFDADSPLAIAYAHVQEEPVAPSSINRALPAAVDALVARALKKNPNERFPNAEAMRDECLRVAASFQPAAPSIVPGSPTQMREGQGEPLQLLDELWSQTVLQFLHRAGVDLLEPHPARLVQRSRTDLFQQLLDHASDPHDLRRLLHHLRHRNLAGVLVASATESHPVLTQDQDLRVLRRPFVPRHLHAAILSHRSISSAWCPQ